MPNFKSLPIGKARMESWRLYFGDEYDDEARLLVAQVKAHVRAANLERCVDAARGCAAVRVSALCAGPGGAALRALLDERPERALAVAGLALAEAHAEAQPAPHLAGARIAVQLLDWGPAVPFAEVRAHAVGRLVTVCGTVVRAAAVRPLVYSMVYACVRCMQETCVSSPGGVVRPPGRCARCGVSRQHVPRPEAAGTRVENWQRLRVQEAASGDEARVPRVLDVELRGALVDAAVPGDAVAVTGVVKTLPAAFGDGHADALYLDAVSLVRPCASLPNRAGVSVAKGDAGLRRAVASFAPRIYGHEMVKLGLVLALLGGGGCAGVRPSVHVLVVGDPGVGKSQMLSYAAALSPRAVVVGANTSSAAGLTAAVHDGGIEAGALVLADGGACCLDEFDKIGADGARALIAAMEQQRVCIAKAGIVASLPARASVLAAANPVGGHYARSKSLADNLRMDAALLSRFDLVFVLVDAPDAQRDRVLSGHVLGGVHSNAGFDGMNRFISPSQGNGQTLRERISGPCDDLLDEGAMRAYIAAARAAPPPRLSAAAASVLRAHYLSLRAASPASGAVVTTRQLEALVRLTEARARLEMRPFATASDARDAVELSLFCALSAEPDRDSVGPSAGVQSSKRPRGNGPRAFIAELARIAARTAQAQFTTDELRGLHAALGTAQPLGQVLDALCDAGCLLRRAPGVYRLLVA